jgi:S1-C subfamily serine protease
MSKVKTATVLFGGLLAAGVICFSGYSAEPAEKEKADLSKPPRIAADARVGALPAQILRALEMRESYRWKPTVDKNKAKDEGAKIYARVAPAIVVMRGPNWHGTGFVIDPAGWIITNNHVVDGVDLDPETGARVLMVNLGRLDEGFMTPLKNEIKGYVYKSDAIKDLALVKLAEVPADIKNLPSLSVAKKVPGAGSTCYLIGHSGIGLLWSFRDGKVSQAGSWPRDMSTNIVRDLKLKGEARRAFERTINSIPATKIVMSSSGTSGGDSGSPVVNDKSEVFAVHFSGPRNEYDREGKLNYDRKGTSKFSYHVHLDELKAFLGGPNKDVKDFLAEQPKAPPLFIPDPWPAGLYHKLKDLDGDGTPDTLYFSLRPGENATGVLIDLAQRSKLTERDLADSKKLRDWKFDFALQFEGRDVRTFYATKGDANIDLIMITTDSKKLPAAELVFRKDAAGKWTKENAKGYFLINSNLFTDKTAQDRFRKIWPNVMKNR